MKGQPSVDPRRSGRGPARKSDLSPERKRLVERMQDLNHGQIRGLIVRGHEPQWSPRPRIVREVVIGKRSGPRPERGQTNFTLKGHIAELCEHFDRAPDGARFTIVVQDGLPFKLSVEEPDRD